MKAPTGNWLLTFSDLFFILVAFFLLRHQMIEAPANRIDKGPFSEEIVNDGAKAKVNKPLRLDESSIFQASHKMSVTSLGIPIHQSWFSQGVEVSSKGEEALRELEWKLKESGANIELELYISQHQASLNSNQRTMLESLVKKLNILKIKLSRVAISAKKRDAEDILGLIKIIYN
jgi:cytochrome c biogenesis protein ResB